MLASFGRVESLSRCAIDEKYGGGDAPVRGMLGKKVEIEFCCEAFTSPRLRHVRIVSFAGQGYDVFNFLAIPAAGCDLPIFGADIVTLPGGVIAAIDFQPLSSSPEYFSSHAAYLSNAELFRKWQGRFPPGGELPAAARQYFSPYALWTRFGASGTGGSGSSDDGPATREATLDQVRAALLEYCNAYTSLLGSTPGGTLDPPRAADAEHFLAEYLSYRIENDPAKRLLVGAFGLEWTEAVLREVLFRG